MALPWRLAPLYCLVILSFQEGFAVRHSTVQKRHPFASYSRKTCLLDEGNPSILGKVAHSVYRDVTGVHVYVSVKTTKSYHEQRLALDMLTWMQSFPPSVVHIVTDVDEDDQWTAIAKASGFTVIRANCSRNHLRQSLCCKSGTEYEGYYKAEDNGDDYSWFCHFDDDIYVNIQPLLATLRRYNPHQQNIYLGRWSVNRQHKMEVPQDHLAAFSEHKSSLYYYATGAAYCISASLMVELENYFRGSAAFMSMCNTFRLPDDMSVGAVIGAVLGYELIEVPAMNSHLNALSTIGPEQLKQQITISYSEWRIASNSSPDGYRYHKNTVKIPNPAFSEEEDTTRFLSYHCLLYPATPWCDDSEKL